MNFLRGSLDVQLPNRQSAGSCASNRNDSLGEWLFWREKWHWSFGALIESVVAVHFKRVLKNISFTSKRIVFLPFSWCFKVWPSRNTPAGSVVFLAETHPTNQLATPIGFPQSLHFSLPLSFLVIAWIGRLPNPQPHQACRSSMFLAGLASYVQVLRSCWKAQTLDEWNSKCLWLTNLTTHANCSSTFSGQTQTESCHPWVFPQLTQTKGGAKAQQGNLSTWVKRLWNSCDWRMPKQNEPKPNKSNSSLVWNPTTQPKSIKTHLKPVADHLSLHFLCSDPPHLCSSQTSLLGPLFAPSRASWNAWHRPGGKPAPAWLGRTSAGPKGAVVFLYHKRIVTPKTTRFFGRFRKMKTPNLWAPWRALTHGHMSIVQYHLYHKARWCEPFLTM